MLAVLAVLLLLMAATVPAVQGLTRSSRRVAAVEKVMALLDQARSTATAQGKAVYVVFADETAGDERDCRAAAIFMEPEDLSMPPVALSGWNILPAGCRFLKNPATPSLFTAPGETPPPLFALPGGNGSRALPYLKFSPTGAVAHPSQSQWTRLFLSASSAATDAPADQISVALFTGRPKCQLAE